MLKDQLLQETTFTSRTGGAKKKVIIQSLVMECGCGHFCCWNSWPSIFQQARSHTSTDTAGILASTSWPKLLDSSVTWLVSTSVVAAALPLARGSEAVLLGTAGLPLLCCQGQKQNRGATMPFLLLISYQCLSLTGSKWKLGSNRFWEIATTCANYIN